MLNIILNIIKRIEYFLIKKIYKQSGIIEGVLLNSAKIENMSNNKDNIKIGKHTYIRGELIVYPHGGKIKIGDYCYIGHNTRIWSASKISIGNNVLISHNVDIHDSNDHPLCARERHEHYKKIITIGHSKDIKGLKEKPIVIEDDAWIGFDSIILKGITIGKGAIIAAGSVVVKDVEPYTIVAGNPARFVKKIEK